MSSVFDHLHIKRHTVGSSNELSFDVLDAARGDLDAKRGRGGRSSTTIRPPRASQGSYHGVTGASPLSSQAEVTRRKQERRAHSVRLWVVAIVAVLGIMGMSTYVGYDFYSDMQDFQRRYASLVDGIVEADKALPQAEAFMADPFSSTTDQRTELRTDVAKAQLQLDQVSEQLTIDADYALSDQDHVALTQAGTAVSSRTSMLAAVDSATRVVDEALKESSQLSAVWNDVLDADQASRSATAAANKADTEKAIKEANEKTQEAKESMSAALDQIRSIGQTDTELDLSQHVAYLELRVSALEHALATSDALLKGDRQLARLENDAYNADDQKAVELAQSLPLSVEETVKDSYTEEISAYRSEYEQARDEAVESDALIRNYIGQ